MSALFDYANDMNQETNRVVLSIQVFEKIYFFLFSFVFFSYFYLLW